MYVVVKLCNQSRDCCLARCNSAIRTTDNSWQTVSNTFKGYPAGVRYSEWEDAGKDAECWSGHYGCVLADAQVLISKPPCGMSCVFCSPSPPYALEADAQIK